MRKMLQVGLIAVAVALLGSSGRAVSRPAQHHRHAARHSSLAARSPSRRHGWSMRGRRTRGDARFRRADRLPVRRHRVYLATTAEARSAGRRTGRRRVVPVRPRLTWRGTRYLPSIGTHHVPPPPPKDMRKPLAPPADQQPLVTPTQPMPT